MAKWGFHSSESLSLWRLYINSLCKNTPELNSRITNFMSQKEPNDHIDQPLCFIEEKSKAKKRVSYWTMVIVDLIFQI